MKQSWLALLLAAGLMGGALVGCGKTAAATGAQAGSGAFDANADWGQITEQARGTTVTFYGWGGDENRNRFLTTTVADALQEKYDVTLELVPMDIDQILSQLAGEKQAGADKGSMDMIWINGENFYSAKENELLFGPFAEKLPAYQRYIDAADTENLKDFGYPIEGYEAPYGKAQMVLIGDSARAAETPKNTEELLGWMKICARICAGSCWSCIASLG